MSWRKIGSVAWLALVVMACNLGSGNAPEPIADDTPAPVVTTPLGPSTPVVTIVSPQDEAEFPVGQQILVSVNATDTKGVTRVQLVVNGSIVKSVNSPNPQTTYPAVLDYTPRAAGNVTLQVTAFNVEGNASNPAELALTIVTRTSSTGSTTGSTTGNSGNSGSGVIIPNDGVCRALNLVNLNLRQVPVSGTVITVIPANTLMPITARLGDNSWWKVNYNNNIGWISGSAQFTSISGNCLNIPVESAATATPTLTPTVIRVNTATPTNTPFPVLTSTPTSPGLPDLIATNISGATTVTLSGPVKQTYSITVSNLGQGPAGAFKVTLYINNTVHTDWSLSGLGRGESIVLQSEVTWNTAGNYTLRVEPDPDKVLAELSDVNNAGTINITVSGS
jgi:hypothetical protein